MRIIDALKWAREELKLKDISSSFLEPRILLAWQLKCSQEFLLMNGDTILNLNQVKIFQNLIKRRLVGMPIAYIISQKEFYGRKFKVTPAVLIPRPDSEVLIDAVKNNYNLDESIEILELGVGSGCLGITLLLEFPYSRLHGIDISKEAIYIAHENACLYQLDQTRIKIGHSNWFENLEVKQYDFIISNPPYIAGNEYNLMSKETIDYEPKLALFSESDDGLSSYREIASKSRNFLKAQGKIFVEIGFNQAEQVKEIFSNNGYSFQAAYADLQGYVRVLVFGL